MSSGVRGYILTFSSLTAIQLGTDLSSY